MFSPLLVLIILLAMPLGSSVNAQQVPSEVPETLCEPARSSLLRERASLSQLVKGIRNGDKAWNQKCSGVKIKAGAALQISCITDASNLDRPRQHYIKKAKNFESRLALAEAHLQVNFFQDPDMQTVRVSMCESLKSKVLENPEAHPELSYLLGKRKPVPFKATKISGDVKFFKGDRELTYSGSGEIMEATRFVTGKDGYVELVFPDGKYLRMKSDSEFTSVEDQNFTGEPTTLEKIGIDLKRGIIRLLSIESLQDASEALTDFEQEMNKRKALRTSVKTVCCEISRRGTDFIIEAEEDGASKIIVFDGEVDVTPEATDETVTLTAGQEAVVSILGEISLSDIDPAKAEQEWQNGIE